MMLHRIGILVVILAGSVVRSQTALPEQPVVTTIYVVRHTERLDGTADSPLSAAGMARAQQLAHVLKDAGITAIFVTEYRRARQTAEPLAAANGLTPIAYAAGSSEGAVSQILSKHVGGRVVIVAHSNTVDDLAAGLGVAGVTELKDNQYDRMYVIQRLGNVAVL
jgi:broad specificity phosphatase PhoE